MGVVFCWTQARGAEVVDGRFLQFSAGRSHYCGVRPDGTVWCRALGHCPDCWGADRALRIPEGGPFVAVFPGAYRTCALDAEGRATCHGDDRNGQVDPPHRLRTMAPGWRHACGVRMDGTTACWGIAQGRPPPERLRKIASAQTRQQCALTRDGELRCWGAASEVLDAPAGRFRDIALAVGSACALDQAGRPVCWGRPREDVWPPGELLAVAIGQDYGCAIRADGVAECDGPLAGPAPRPCEQDGELACFSGAPEQADVGRCRAGVQQCVDGFATRCAGERLPAQGGESCNAVDDDCDGAVDEDFEVGAPCVAVGECGAGVWECAPNRDRGCSSSPQGSDDGSSRELCDGLDNDCDTRVDEACCGEEAPEVEWVRPGGFWSELAGHPPFWRAAWPDRGCVLGQRDACDRLVRVSYACLDCGGGACCEPELTECSHNYTYAYDEPGRIVDETWRFAQIRRGDTSRRVSHTYDAHGARLTTRGTQSGDEVLPATVVLRYENDDQGRLVREEAMEGVDDVVEDPWVPTRVSDFEWLEDAVVERLDSDADGVVDEVLRHPLP